MKFEHDYLFGYQSALSHIVKLAQAPASNNPGLTSPSAPVRPLGSGTSAPVPPQSTSPVSQKQPLNPTLSGNGVYGDLSKYVDRARKFYTVEGVPITSEAYRQGQTKWEERIRKREARADHDPSKWYHMGSWIKKWTAMGRAAHARAQYDRWKDSMYEQSAASLARQVPMTWEEAKKYRESNPDVKFVATTGGRYSTNKDMLHTMMPAIDAANPKLRANDLSYVGNRNSGSYNPFMDKVLSNMTFGNAGAYWGLNPTEFLSSDAAGRNILINEFRNAHGGRSPSNDQELYDYFNNNRVLR